MHRAVGTDGFPWPFSPLLEACFSSQIQLRTELVTEVDLIPMVLIIGSKGTLYHTSAMAVVQGQ